MQEDGARAMEKKRWKIGLGGVATGVTGRREDERTEVKAAFICSSAEEGEETEWNDSGVKGARAQAREDGRGQSK